MKRNHKRTLFERGLRTGVLFVYFLFIVCVSAGCGSEEMDRLFADLLTEEALLTEEDFGEAESGYPETEETDLSIAGLQGAQPEGSVKELLSAEQNVGAGELQGAEYSVGAGELQGSAGSVGAKELQGAGQSVGALSAGYQPEIEKIYVHVCGEVKSPGVYELPAGSRFYEAVEAAGGFTEEACRDYLNMAASLADGSRLEIPAAQEVLEREKTGSKGKDSGGESTETEYHYYTLQDKEDAGPADTSGGNASEGLVNINTADIAGLCALPGIGEGRAKAIVEYREKQGGFRKKEDIMQVSGIGEKMYARMEAYLTVE